MLISCVAYENGRKLADIPKEEIREHLGKPGRFVWVALREPDPEELEDMRGQFDLHELAVEDALHGHQRPKVEEYGDCVFVVMHTLELTEPNGDIHDGEVNIFVGSDYIVSVRKRTRQGFAEVRKRAEREPELLKEGPGYVLYMLIDTIVDRYFPVMDALEDKLETIEERIFREDAGRSAIEALYALKRQLVVIRHAAVPAHEAVGKLYGGRVPAVTLTTQEYFRDVYDHLYRINISIDAIRDTISTAIQVNLSMVAIDESEVNKRLAAWAAIFAVATAFAGIWGMNFEHMPELQWKYGYPVALAAMVGTCLYLYRRFRKSGWL